MSEMSTPAWSTPVSWVFVGIALLSAAFIAYDILVRGHRERDGAMNLVWPATALYFGPLAVWGYVRDGRRRSQTWRAEHATAPDKDLTNAALTGGTPGGAASLVAVGFSCAYELLVRPLVARGVKAVA